MYAVVQYTDCIEAFSVCKMPYPLLVHYKFNFIYTHKKSTALPALTVMKHASIQQRYVQISCSKFHPNQTLKWKVCVEIHLHTLAKCVFRCADFRETNNYKIAYSIKWRYSVPNFIQEVWKIGQKFIYTLR
jgi:hypothetical protein